MSTIAFNNRKYRIRQVEIEGMGTRLIASTVLNNKLISPEGRYASKEAILVDEQIYFYVEPSILKLRNAELVQYVNNYCV